MSAKTVRILIVDDHPAMLAGLRSFLRPEKDLEVCGSAASSSQALERAAQQPTDLALVDLQLPDRGGLELIKDLRVLYPNLVILVISFHDERFYAQRALSAGAMGYVMKGATPETIIRAIRRTLRGEVYLSPRLTQTLTNSMHSGGFVSPLQRLTDREMEVFEQIGAAKGLEEIGQILQISCRTVEAHRTNIRKKLGYPDSNALFRFAVQWHETEKLGD